MGLATNLVRRNAIYYVRMRVPAALVEVLKRKEVSKSLNTADPRLAKQLAPAAVAAIHDEWRAACAERPMGLGALLPSDDDDPRRLALRYYNDVWRAVCVHPPGHADERSPSEDDLRRYALEYYYFALQHDLVDRDNGGRRLQLSIDGMVAGQLSEAIECLNLGHHFGPVGFYVELICQRDGYPVYVTTAIPGEEIDPETGDPHHHRVYRKIGQALLRAHIEVLKRRLERDAGDYAGQPKDPLLFDLVAQAGGAQAARSSPPAASTSTLAALASVPLPAASVCLDGFGEWGRASAGWRGNATAQALASMRLFIEMCGDKPINRYTRVDCDNFRATLRRLPNGYRKSASDKDKPIADIIAVADATGAPRLKDKTVKRHFWSVSRFFSYLLETGHLPHDSLNPARGFSFNTKGAVRQLRHMWKGEELTRLFTSPVWTGCHPTVRTRAGSVVIRDSLFWLPVLGLYHGNRLEEFAQLYREDLRQEAGVWVLRICDEGDRQLKNPQSIRLVPLHPQLIRMGFLEFVASGAPNPTDRIFGSLKPTGHDKKLGPSFTKQFSRYREQIGVKRTGLDYHSFRHGVTTKLSEARVSDGWIDLITGHEGGSESQKRYLKGIDPHLLKSALMHVQWPEANFEHLYVRADGDERWPEGSGISRPGGA